MRRNSTSLPIAWRWAELGELGRFDSGGTPDKQNSSYWEGNIPFVTGADITSLHISSKNARAFLTEAGLTSGKTAVCGPGTVLIVTRTRVGRVGIATERLGVSQDLTPYECGPDILPDFVTRYLQSLSRFFVENSRGATIKGITRDFISSVQVPLPPVPEQRRIVGLLNKHLQAVEQARTAATVQLQAANPLLTSNLLATFGSDSLRRWPRVQLGRLLQLRKEIVHPRDNRSGPAAFVGLEHIEPISGRRIGSQPVEISKLTGRKPRFYTGDIVYGYLRPYLNKVWIAEFDGLCSVDQYVYSVDGSQADTEFLAWFMRSPTYLRRAPISTTPGQLPRIRIEEVAAVDVNLPPLIEQRTESVERSGRVA
jgi:restriction endonuclease S subunit